MPGALVLSGAAGGNRTTEAIRAACGGQARRVVDEVTFSSERKWRAVAFDDEALRGVYVLGAPEMLQPCLTPLPGPPPVADRGGEIDEWTAQGLRVLIFAHQPEVTPLHDAHSAHGWPTTTHSGGHYFPPTTIST